MSRCVFLGLLGPGKPRIMLLTHQFCELPLTVLHVAAFMLGACVLERGQALVSVHFIIGYNSVMGAPAL